MKTLGEFIGSGISSFGMNVKKGMEDGIKEVAETEAKKAEKKAINDNTKDLLIDIKKVDDKIEQLKKDREDLVKRYKAAETAEAELKASLKVA